MLCGVDEAGPGWGCMWAWTIWRWCTHLSPHLSFILIRDLGGIQPWEWLTDGREVGVVFQFPLPWWEVTHMEGCWIFCWAHITDLSILLIYVTLPQVMEFVWTEGSFGYSDFSDDFVALWLVLWNVCVASQVALLEESLYSGCFPGVSDGWTQGSTWVKDACFSKFIINI